MLLDSYHEQCEQTHREERVQTVEGTAIVRTIHLVRSMLCV
jgi:hypothetical protein